MNATAPAAEPAEQARAKSRGVADWKVEAFSLCLLAAMVAYFLVISWRKWPDPLVDSGPQLYATWQVSEGGHLYHDFLWTYGPFSICLNAVLFKIFEPGLMVLATANLVFYAAILSLAYLAFRKAWGRLAAFASLAVFISVFSFSHLLGVGNYNFVTPYAPEASHGMLLILATAFIVTGWHRKNSLVLSFLLGLCGGISAVMKPEFMLACGLLGIAALGLRWRRRIRWNMAEFAAIAAGLVLPTLLFTLWFARVESFKQGFIDASQAWWLVLVTHIQNGNAQQLSFLGLDHPWANIMREIACTGWALLVLGAIWSIGRLASFHWTQRARVFAFGVALVLALLPFITGEWVFVRDWFLSINSGWINVGRCLPGLMVVILILALARLVREFRQTKQFSESSIMALMLVLLAAAMLARMLLFARVFHLGFFQAALAGMVVAAVMVSELPRWTGESLAGRRAAAICALFILALGCGTIVAKSNAIRAEQTEPVGRGRDRFYSTKHTIDGTGALVNWVSERLRSAPAKAEVLVLPEGGTMINYLSRHKSPSNVVLRESEEKFVGELRRNPPEYVVLISRDLKEFGVTRYGAPGNPGFALVPWVSQNYQSEAWVGGDPLDPNARVGAVVMHRNPETKEKSTTTRSELNL
ncbi:MAG TPA: hypothetical protein VFB72_12655 [Verrucomicrobiae bacterium]|nr:hypothetical protein [Verrucomicrobiae bacterium]